MTLIEKYVRELGFKIAFYRKSRGFTQKELADRLGVSRTHISNIEAARMKTGISLELLLRICQVLKLKPEELMRLDQSAGFVTEEP